MLYVQTKNFKQQTTLQQQFSREGNLFAIPFKKTSQIKTILEGIIFEIFNFTGLSNENGHNEEYPLSFLLKKLIVFFEDSLKLVFSLSTIRQILEIIKGESHRIELHQQYFAQINNRFLDDSDQQNAEFNKLIMLSSIIESQKPFQDNFDATKYKVLQMMQEDHQNNQQIKDISPENQNQNYKASELDSSVRQENYESLTMHSLKSQFTFKNIQKNEAFSSAGFARQKLYCNKLQNSFECSERDLKQQPNEIVFVSEVLTIQNTQDIFFCPDWKKNEDEKKKMIKSIYTQSTTTTKKTIGSTNGSNYIQNLSGRVQPLPSFLHDESLGEIIVKEKKQDIRKSKILKDSIHGCEDKKSAISEQGYTSNLRLIKFKNKMRKSQKNNLNKVLSKQKDGEVMKSKQTEKILFNVHENNQDSKESKKQATPENEYKLNEKIAIKNYDDLISNSSSKKNILKTIKSKNS